MNGSRIKAVSCELKATYIVTTEAEESGYNLSQNRSTALAWYSVETWAGYLVTTAV